MHRLLLALLLAAASAVPGARPEGAWRHDVDRAAFAALGAAPQLQAVGAIVRTGDSLRTTASAVLVAPQWALTAAHTVDRPERHRDTRFVFGRDTVAIAAVVIHPGYHPTSPTAVDLALVRLARPVTAVAPAALHRDADERGARVTIAGFGYALPGNTLAGGQTPPGTRHAGMNVVDSVTAAHLLLDLDAPGRPELNRLGGAEPDSLEYIPSGGDSGGGVFVRRAHGWALAGISGNVDIDLAQAMEAGWYGSVVRVQRVSAAMGWIESVIGAER